MVGIVIKTKDMSDGSKLKKSISTAYLKEIRSRKIDRNLQREKDQASKKCT